MFRRGGGGWEAANPAAVLVRPSPPHLRTAHMAAQANWRYFCTEKLHAYRALLPYALLQTPVAPTIRRVTFSKEGPKCGSTKRFDGKPCGNPAGMRTDHYGYGHCWLHAGRAPAHRVSAARTKVKTNALALLEQMGEPLPMANPIDRLLQLGGEADHWLAVMRAQVQELGGTFTTTDHFGAEVLRAVVKEYTSAMDQVARIAERIAKLDLQAEHIRLERAKAATIWHAIELGIAATAVPDSLAHDLAKEIAAQLRQADMGMQAALPQGRKGRPGGAEIALMAAHRAAEAPRPKK